MSPGDWTDWCRVRAYFKIAVGKPGSLAAISSSPATYRTCKPHHGVSKVLRGRPALAAFHFSQRAILILIVKLILMPNNININA